MTYNSSSEKNRALRSGWQNGPSSSAPPSTTARDSSASSRENRSGDPSGYGSSAASPECAVRTRARSQAPDAASATSSAVAIHYEIEPSDPHAHLFSVSVHVAATDPGGLEFYLPVWTPGSYLIRDFARHLEAVTATWGERSIAIVKTAKSRWRCLAGNEVQSTSSPAAASGAGLSERLVVRYRVYAWDISVRAAHLDAEYGFFNGTSVFLAVARREHEAVTVAIRPPAGGLSNGWRLATTLARADSRANEDWAFGLFRAANYDELVDHPVQMGRFETASFDVGGCHHEIVVSAAPTANLERIARDLAPVCAKQIALFEPMNQRAPVSRYLFLVLATGNGYGGLEHRSSCALICSRDDLPWQGLDDKSSPPNGYVNFLGLASHEYFHTWHVKRIKPAVFDPYNWLQETTTSLLWIFEGFTSYYDDLMLRRAGTIDDRRYLTTLEQSINRVRAAPGRHLQTTAESSFDAWTKYYRQDENSPNSIVSYYVKGSLIALALDLSIRGRSKSRRSLDDVMRVMWNRWGRDFYGLRQGSGHGLEEDRFPAVVQEATGLDLGDEINAWAYGTQDLPLAQLLRSVGVRVEQAPSLNAASIGAKVSPREGGMLVRTAERDGPLTLAGLATGDLLIAIDGLRCSEHQLQTTLARSPVGTTTVIHAFRRGHLIQANVKLAASRPDIRLVPVGTSAARRRWLEG